MWPTNGQLLLNGRPAWWTSHKHSRICSEHFNVNETKLNKRKIHLKPGGIPVFVEQRRTKLRTRSTSGQPRLGQPRQVNIYINSFILSFIHSFIHLIIHLLIHPIINSFSIFIHSLIQLFIHSFILSFIHSFIHSLIH